VLGALGLVDRDGFKELFSCSVPLLRAGGNNKKLILAPLMRYVLEGCCANPSHCNNRTRDYRSILGEGLARICEWLDDQAYLKRIRNFGILNPTRLLDTGALDAEKAKRVMNYWTAGPVHMTPSGYEHLAKNLVEAIPQLTFTRCYGPQEEAVNPPQQPQQQEPRTQPRNQPPKSKVDWADRRKGWVNNSDAIAHRSAERGQYNPRGNWRGQRGGRGGRGGRTPGHRGHRARGTHQYRPY
jgi:hypothetical protein